MPMEIFNRTSKHDLSRIPVGKEDPRNELVGYREEDATRLMPWHFKNSTHLVPEGWGVQVWQHQMIGSFSQAAANLYMCQHDGGILVSYARGYVPIEASPKFTLVLGFLSATMPKARKSLLSALLDPST